MSFQFVRKTDIVKASGDSHGKPCCSHSVQGPTILSFSPNVIVNNINAIRINDRGKHSSCCGPNTFSWISASPNVFANDRKVCRSGVDKTRHCGGAIGRAPNASPDVFVNK